MNWNPPSTVGFTTAVALLFPNKHKNIVIGLLWENMKQEWLSNVLIHSIYLHSHNWADWSLPQDFSMLNHTFKTILETNLEVFLGGSIYERTSLQYCKEKFIIKNNEKYSKKTMNLISRHKAQTPTLGKISKIYKKEYCKFLRFGALVFF